MSGAKKKPVGVVWVAVSRETLRRYRKAKADLSWAALPGQAWTGEGRSRELRDAIWLLAEAVDRGP